MTEHLNISALFSQNYQRFSSNFMHFVTPWYILKNGWKPTGPPKRNLLLNISAIRWPNGSVASRKNVATWWLSRRQMRQQITLSFAWLVLRYRGKKRREALQPLFKLTLSFQVLGTPHTWYIIGCKIPIIFYGTHIMVAPYKRGLCQQLTFKIRPLASLKLKEKNLLNLI